MGFGTSIKVLKFGKKKNRIKTKQKKRRNEREPIQLHSA